jgi:aarF domain-containing kinase
MTSWLSLFKVVGFSSRALVMTFEEGLYVTNDCLFNSQEKGGMALQRADVARLISETFCKQMFRHGFVHCDPHEANLLVRPHATKKGQPQLVLLDHGLYRELPEGFRWHYCRLWRGLVSADERAIETHCAAMGAARLHTLLAAMLTMKPWDDIVDGDIAKLRRQGSAGESEMLRGYAERYFSDIVGLLGKVPSELLLMLKTNDCLRHIDKALGVPINTATVVARITNEVRVPILPPFF